MEELRKKVKECGLKQVFMAHKVGVSDIHLSLMLTGRAKMSEEVKKRLNKLIDQANKLTV